MYVTDVPLLAWLSKLSSVAASFPSFVPSFLPCFLPSFLPYFANYSNTSIAPPPSVNNNCTTTHQHEIEWFPHPTGPTRGGNGDANGQSFSSFESFEQRYFMPAVGGRPAQGIGPAATYPSTAATTTYATLTAHHGSLPQLSHSLTYALNSRAHRFSLRRFIRSIDESSQILLGYRQNQPIKTTITTKQFITTNI